LLLFFFLFLAKEREKKKTPTGPIAAAPDAATEHKRARMYIYTHRWERQADGLVENQTFLYNSVCCLKQTDNFFIIIIIINPTNYGKWMKTIKKFHSLLYDGGSTVFLSLMEYWTRHKIKNIITWLIFWWWLFFDGGGVWGAEQCVSFSGLRRKKKIAARVSFTSGKFLRDAHYKTSPTKKREGKEEKLNNPFTKSWL
jgi:hypothetical protein